MPIGRKDVPSEDDIDDVAMPGAETTDAPPEETTKPKVMIHRRSRGIGRTGNKPQLVSRRVRQPGKGRSYDPETIAFVRAMWASGHYRSDLELAQALGFRNPETGRVLISKWRSEAAPDGVPWEQVRTEFMRNVRAHLTELLGERVAELIDGQLRIANYLEQIGLMYLGGRTLELADGSVITIPRADIDNADTALRILTTGMTIKYNLLQRQLSPDELKRYALIEERRGTLPPLTAQQREEMTKLLIRMLDAETEEKKNGQTSEQKQEGAQGSGKGRS